MKPDQRGSRQLDQPDDPNPNMPRSHQKAGANGIPRPHLLLGIYQSLMSALLPIYLIVKLIRGRLKDKHIKELSLFDQYAQSLGFRLPPIDPKSKGLVWIHAVSMGELNTVKPLIDQLLVGGYPVLVTNTTATGYWRTQSLYADRVLHCPMVIDQPSAVSRFLRHFSPAQLVLVETEIWPTVLDFAYRSDLPVALINARLTEKSAARLSLAPKLSQYLMGGFDLILCQDQRSVSRFTELGARPDRVKGCTNLKFLSAQSSAASLPNRENYNDTERATESVSFGETDTRSATVQPFILTAASTHDPEERIILEVFERLQASNPEELILILVPRHPERFDEVARLLGQMSMTFCRRSLGHSPGNTAVFLGDTLGELEHWYAISDLAFIGGSIAKIGGHTPMEAVKYAVPVVMGHHTHKCQDMVDQLLDVGALLQAQTADELFLVCQAALSKTAQFQDRGARGQALLERLALEAQKQIDVLIELMEVRGGS